MCTGTNKIYQADSKNCKATDGFVHSRNYDQVVNDCRKMESKRLFYIVFTDSEYYLEKNITCNSRTA